MTERRAREVKAVEMMRAIRDELSRKLQGMTHDEQREFMKAQLARPKAPHEEAHRSSA